MQNLNSPKNQSIKSILVQRDVHCCVSIEASYILNQNDRNAPYTFEDIENMYAASVAVMDDWIAENLSQDEISDMYEDLDAQQLSDINREDLQQYLEAEHNFEPEPAEIYEYWKVSGWLLEELQQRGEAVIPCADIWCRQATGQAILLDSIISEIAADMGILAGQKNEWSEK